MLQTWYIISMIYYNNIVHVTHTVRSTVHLTHITYYSVTSDSLSI